MELSGTGDRRCWRLAIGVLAALCAVSPARAQTETAEPPPPTAEPPPALSIRAVEPEPRPRFSAGRLLKDLVYGVTWDRARLPLNVSLRGNDQSPFSVRLSLSRRNFSGATLRFRF